MAERRVSVKFSAEIHNFKAATESMAQATQKVKKAAEDAGKATEQASKAAVESAKRHSESLERVGAAATIGGTAVLAGVGLAVKSYADFDKAMSSVDAATHETAGNMKLLREAAIDAGADTAFSAAEAAKGIEELAKAGVSTKDILAGGLNGSLALAAAGSLDVGKAAEIAASAMTQFKLSGDKIPHVADLLAAGAGKAQGSVEDLGAALNQSGLVAASTGLTIEETTGALAAFASAGLVGSDAGTSFKTMLMSLNPNSEAAATLMDELGISAYDAQGNFVGMSEYAGILQGALKGMSDEQRNATLKTLFGSDAVRAATILYEQGAGGVQKWEDAVNDAGYAAETAARMQDNLAGDLEKLGGAFDTVLIKSGSGANEVLRGLVQGLEGFVDAVGRVPAPVLAAGTGVAALAGGAALIGGALITVIPKIKATKDALNDLAPAGGRARAGMDKFAKGAEAVGAFATAGILLGKFAEADYMSKIDTGMGKVADALAEVATEGPGASSALDDLFKDRTGGDLINTVTDLESAINRTFNRDGGQQFNDWGEAVVNGMTGIKGSSQILTEQFDRLDQGLADLVSGGNTDDAKKTFDEIKQAAEDQGVTVEQLVEKFPKYGDALSEVEAATKTAAAEGKNLDGSLNDVGQAASDAAKQSEEIQQALEDVGLSAEGAVTDLAKFTESLVAAGLLQLSARDAARNYEAALDTLTESVTKNGTTLDINTEAGRANQAAFDAIASAGIRSAEAMAVSGASQKDVQGKLKNTYTDLYNAARGFGMTDGQAQALARSVLGVPKGVSISSWMSDQAKRTAENTKVAVDNIPPSKTVTITTIQHTINRIETQRVGGTDGIGDDASLTALRPGKRETGGRLPAFAYGGQLPMTGPGTDRRDGFLGVSSAGMPLARVDAGEWIINRGSSGRYNRELAAINAGTFPKLPGFAGGGRAEFSAQHFGYAPYRSDGSPGGGVTNKWYISEQSSAAATAAEVFRRQRMQGT